MNNNLSVFNFESDSIRFENRNGRVWVSLTDMAKASGKKIDNWKRLESTNEFLVALEHSLQCEVMVSNVGGSTETTGTWAIEEVAIEFAGWCSVGFKIWMITQIKTLMTEGTVSIKPEPKPQLPSYEIAQKTAEAINVIQDKLALTQPRLTQFLIEAAMNDVNRMMLLPPAEPNQETLMTCEAWGNENGFSVTKANRSALGKFIAKQWRLETNSEPIAQKQECGGAMREIKVYPVSFLSQKLPLYFS